MNFYLDSVHSRLGEHTDKVTIGALSAIGRDEPRSLLITTYCRVMSTLATILLFEWPGHLISEE